MQQYHFYGPDARDQNASSVPGVPAVASGAAGTAAGAPATLPSMAESVTRHTLNPSPEQFQFLLCGIDSLDLGLYVDWGTNWEEQGTHFLDKKEDSYGTNGIPDTTKTGRPFLHLPSGKAPNYRFHLQFPEYHAYIAIREKPSEKAPSPNVYISLSADTLWKNGVLPSLDLVYRDICSFGGNPYKFVPSRVDLAADYLIPGGLTLPFLQQHQVCRSRAVVPYLNGDELETYYVGSPNTPVRLRIYNKSKEVLKGGVKLWFFDIWKVDQEAEVWRVEFQLRRTVLHQFRLDAFGDLWDKVGGLWTYLTGEWFSLRFPDNDKAERRTIHPWWQDVQNCAEILGPAIQVQRYFTGDTPASTQWLLAHITGCITSLAARKGIADRGTVLDQLRGEVARYCPDHVFQEEFLKRSIKLGRNPLEQGGANEEDYPF